MGLDQDQSGESSREDVPVYPRTGCLNPVACGEGAPQSEPGRKTGVSKPTLHRLIQMEVVRTDGKGRK